MRSRLSPAALTAWRLVDVAADLPTPLLAGIVAQAMALSGWEAFPLVYSELDRHVHASDLMPRGRVYFQADGYDRYLLVHPGEAEFFSLAPGLRTMFGAAQAAGEGLQDLAPVLIAPTLAVLDVPDDARSVRSTCRPCRAGCRHG